MILLMTCSHTDHDVESIQVNNMAFSAELLPGHIGCPVYQTCWG